MVLGKGDASRVALVAGDLIMEQEADMNLFHIKEHHLVNTIHSRKGVTMEIKFKRKITSEMMTTYLPSILLMMITFATTFFKPFFFEAALSVNLTTMLVMTTIFISKMEGLPPTSDIKMIDIWLILCQLVPFAQVALLTAMEYLREEEEKEEEVELKEEGPPAARRKATRENEREVKESNVSFEPKPKKTWVSMNKQPVKANTMEKLLFIGRLLLHF